MEMENEENSYDDGITHCEEIKIEPGDEGIEYSEYMIEEIVETEEFVEEEFIVCEEIENQIQYQCDICQRLFDKHYYLERHMQHHNEEENDDNNYNEEVLEDDPQEDDVQTYDCDTCKEKFYDIESLNEHNKTVHKRNRIYKCSICTKIYRTRHSLYKHFHQCHTEEDRCIACDERFTDIIEHVKQHHGEKCPVCEKHFFNLDELHDHIVSIHVAKIKTEKTDDLPELKCNICSKQFKNVIHLQAHMRRTHSKEKILECPLCGKQFKSANSFTCYTSHINIHTGEKPYKCQYCSKTFSNSGTLHKHKKIHTGENFHRCSLCDKKFRDASYLTRHIKSCSYRYSG